MTPAAPDSVVNPVPSSVAGEAPAAAAAPASSAAPPATAAPADELRPTVQVETINAVSKRLKISIPEGLIRREYAAAMTRLRRESAMPGFRQGRVPPRLLEKRLGQNLRDEVKTRLINESFATAVKEHTFKPVGEAHVDLADLKLPETGAMDFTVEIEVAPEFPLPDLSQFQIQKPLLEASEERFRLALEHLQRNLGSWSDCAEPAGAQDRLLVDMQLTGEDGAVLWQRQDLWLDGGSVSVEGIQIDDLPGRLAGATVGTKLVLTATIPPDSIRADLRGRKINIALSVKRVQRLHVPPLDDTLAKSHGFDNLEELKASLRGSLQERLAGDVARLMRRQLMEQLLEKIPLDLPPAFATRYLQKAIQRREIEMLQRGVPVETIQKQSATIVDLTSREVYAEIALFFITTHLAERFDITVTEDELDAEIVALAALQGRRPERLRQELRQRGRLEPLLISVRDRKVLDYLVTQCQVTPVEETRWNELVRQRQEEAARREAVQRAVAAAPESSGPGPAGAAPELAAPAPSPVPTPSGSSVPEAASTGVPSSGA